jgi:cytochrome c-type biogenesis protein CcmH/NrfF
MSALLRTDQNGRAALFAVAGLAALFLAIPFSIWLAQSPAGLSQADRLGAEIGCVCGTCPLRPIATCGCGFADGMLARLDQEVAAGHSDDEIMATFVAEYGSSIKIKPEGSGVGLLAWLAPMAFLMVGAVAMAGIISHWRAKQSAEATADSTSLEQAPAAGDSAPASAEADRYRKMIERELDNLDG